MLFPWCYRDATQLRQLALNDAMTAGHVPADYIDPTKSLFPLSNYSQSVDKWRPSGSDWHVSAMDTTVQLRYFSDLKSRYFGMGANEKSPWNSSYHSGANHAAYR